MITDSSQVACAKSLADLDPGVAYYSCIFKHAKAKAKGYDYAVVVIIALNDIISPAWD